MSLLPWKLDDQPIRFINGDNIYKYEIINNEILFV
jgi:hypothetical protein